MNDDMERHRAVFIGELEARIASLEARVGELEEAVTREPVVDWIPKPDGISGEEMRAKVSGSYPNWANEPETMWPKSMDTDMPTGTVRATDAPKEPEPEHTGMLKRDGGSFGDWAYVQCSCGWRTPGFDYNGILQDPADLAWHEYAKHVAPKPERPTKVDGRPYCGDVGPKTFVCTLSEGHDSDHVAMDAAGSGEFSRWRRTEDAPKAEERRCGEYAPFGSGYACSKPLGHFGLHDWAEAEEREPVSVPETEGDRLDDLVRVLAEAFAEEDDSTYTGLQVSKMLFDVLKGPKNGQER